MGIAILGNTQLRRRQTLPNVDDRAFVELGGTVRNDLLEAAEGKDNRSRDKEEERGSPVINEEITSRGFADRLRPEVKEPSENVRVDGGEAGVFSLG